jgi:hypothetical protein
MRHVAWLPLLPLIAGACLGGGSGRGASSGVSPLAGSPPLPATTLTVSYPIGGLIAVRSKLARCPTGASCHDVRLGGCPPGSTCLNVVDWVRVAVRRIACSPPAGDYQNPRSACAALGDLEHRLQQPAAAVCECPLVLARYPQARAAGRYQRRRITIALDGCSLCGLGVQAAHDAAVLMPQH